MCFVHCRSTTMAYSPTTAIPTRTRSSWFEPISYWRVQSAVPHGSTLCWSTAGIGCRLLVLTSPSYDIDCGTVPPTPEAEVLAAVVGQPLQAAAVLTDGTNHIRSVHHHLRVCRRMAPLLRSAYTPVWVRNGITTLQLTVCRQKAVRLRHWIVLTTDFGGRRLQTATPGRISGRRSSRRQRRWTAVGRAPWSTDQPRQRLRRRRRRGTVNDWRGLPRRRRQTQSPEEWRHQNLTVWRHTRDRDSQLPSFVVVCCSCSSD